MKLRSCRGAALALLPFVLIISSILSAQEFGAIRGTVFDSVSGNPLIGANVMVIDTNLGAAADENGRYVIRLVPPGRYDVRVQYISYEPLVVEGVVIEDNYTVTLDFDLIPSRVEVQSVEVRGTSNRGSEVDLLLTQKKSDIIESGIGSTQIRRSGDSNAADALKRVSGVTVVDDKFIYVRGLGDRYSTTQMNNVNLPSPEPDKRAVPLNMFSSALVEEIKVFKTFLPNLPGTFAGGTVNIRTKAYPEKRVFSASVSAGGNSELGAFPFRRSNGGSMDFWGYDDGTRDVSATLPDDVILKTDYGYWNSELGQWVSEYPNGMNRQEWQNQLGEYGRSIESNYKVPAKSESLPISFKINGGDVFHPSDNFEFGYYGSFNFGNKYSARHHDYRQYAITQAIEDNRAITVYDTSQLITRQESSYSTNMGINFSTGFKYNEWLKVDYQHLFTHISKDKVNYGWGKSGNIDDGIFVNQDYEEKSINSGTMHVGADLAGYGELQMTLNMSKSELYRPDSRSQVYKKAADQAEEFDDYNDNGIWDAEVSEEFVDSNNNGVWDQGLSETFNDINNNGEWDMGEPFTDVDGDGICGSTEWAFGFCDDTNGNGQWDGPETFIDLNGNGVWDASYDEELVDYNDNDEYDPVLAEGFVDENNNGVWDEVANLWEYRMMTSTQGEDAGKRSYNVGNETNESLSIDYEVPLSRFNFKTGLLLESKDRSFTKRELYTGYIFADGTGDPTSWPQHLLSNHVDSLGYVFENENWYVYDSAEDQETGGIVLLEQTASLSRNTYDASEGINAAYMMLDIPVNNVIQVIAGVRVEDYSLDLRPYNRISGETYYSNVLDTTVTADIDEMKYLPSFITNLTVNDRTKLRLAFSETLARPQFREVAPYDYEEFYGGEKAVGYPFLKTTSIQNYDIRYEFYPSAGEVISVAVFRKEFENPIDVAAIMQQENFYKVYQNAKTAKSSGIELEARLKIPYLKRFPDAYGYLVFNGTYTDSKVETHDEFYLFNGYSVANAAANLNRPLQGQSDLVMNASLNVGRYEDIDLTFSFNTFSKRLISVGGGVLNDEYEYPFHSLNAVISKTLDENWKLSFKATNLLNSEVKYGLEDRETGDVYYTKTYKPGMDASLALSFTI